MQKQILEYIRKNRLLIFLILCVLLGLWASVGLQVDQVNLLSNKKLFVECNLNPLFSCTKVMQTQYSSMFGIPNPILGLIGYSAIGAFLGLLLTETKLSRFPMLVVLAFSFSAFVFSCVLMGISMFIIHAICPLCLSSAFASTNIFAGILYLNFKQGNLGKRITASKLAKSIFTPKYYRMIVIGWFVFVCLAIYIKYPTILNF